MNGIKHDSRINNITAKGKKMELAHVTWVSCLPRACLAKHKIYTCKFLNKQFSL